ncbi:photoreceptor outer segment membrane glycoprotein 2-like [Pollicipes pollicipes]|uniref:photoreceptor outer segment membrane glycoprotein 2-like n=1 Tax=Pollicipes pollicipes TaxID=41117 RepID=UPI0018851909|nr:photoreceptor outer segment membrane glycoprotein 2-like [Pollicipes pollicipes]
MQCLKIKMTETCRCRAGIVLFFLNITIVLVCHATGAMGLVMKQEVASISDFLVFYNTSSLFKLLFCVSLLFLVFHLIGAKICFDSAFYETRERFHSVLFYWLLAGCALIPLSVAAIIVLTAHQSLVMHAISLGFKHAMKKYKIDASMREYINRLQIEHQCCGATSVSDWFKVSWVDVGNTVPISQLANSRYMQANGEFLPRWAPFSCCRQDSIGAPCESVTMFFQPKKSADWVKKSKIYSIDYLSQFDRYKAVFKNVSAMLHDPPEAMMRRGRRTVQGRRATFDAFLRGGSSPERDVAVETMRTLLEARGVRAQSFPAAVLRHLGAPPWRGRMYCDWMAATRPRP